MGELTGHLTIVIGVSVAAFLGPLLAVLLLVRRKRRARQTRISPIDKKQLLRAPGQTLREQLDEAQTDASFDLLLLAVLPLTLLATALAQRQLSPTRTLGNFTSTFYVVAWLAVVAYGVIKLVRRGADLDKLKAGYDAELAVGQELDQLMRKGAAVFHDVPAEGFNIDHVVIAASGVFAVETKGFTKSQQLTGRARFTVVFDGQQLRFPEWSSSEPLEQAQRQAAWLARWLGGAIGEPVAVLPVLALPGWFVERKGRGAVHVYSGKELEWLTDKPSGLRPLSAIEQRRIEHQIEQRCRNVTPTYKEDRRAL